MVTVAQPLSTTPHAYACWSLTIWVYVCGGITICIGSCLPTLRHTFYTPLHTPAHPPHAALHHTPATLPHCTHTHTHTLPWALVWISQFARHPVCPFSVSLPHLHPIPGSGSVVTPNLKRRAVNAAYAPCYTTHRMFYWRRAAPAALPHRTWTLRFPIRRPLFGV